LIEAYCRFATGFSFDISRHFRDYAIISAFADADIIDFRMPSVSLSPDFDLATFFKGTFESLFFAPFSFERRSSLVNTRGNRKMATVLFCRH